MKNALVGSFALSALLSACGPTAEDGAGNGLKLVPRNRTLILDCLEVNICSGQIKDYDSFNPYIPGRTSRTGWNFLFEPLYFYNAYRDENNIIPWLAESHTFNEDFTEIQVSIRAGVEWSDGMPWTAHDLVFTLNMLKENAPNLLFSTDMQTWVKEAVAEDDLTAKITLNAPNPRFIFTYFTHCFGNGVPIVPKHIWEGQDPKSFANFDLLQGWPVVSGPYQIALSEPGQRIWDLRRDWWGAKTGFRALPEVQRIIYLPYMDEVKRVQSLIANNLDSCLDMRPANIKSIVHGNPNVATWSGRQLPYGYLDWWPISLGFNNLEEPFSDPEIRWAVNYAIDREQLLAIGWEGSGEYALLPFPDFPPLRRFTSQVQDLVEQSSIALYDPERTAEILTRKGWARDEEGLWVKDEQPLKVVIDIATIFQDLAPVLVAQLKRAGFDASFRMTSDVYTRMTQGMARSFMFGNGGSVRDPYFTLRLYHSRFVRPTGTAAEIFWRWQNEEYDRIVDQMGQTAPDDPQLLVLFRQAMEIWIEELPSIPLVQWYHRIPHNETYWTNWPTAANPYINSAYWHTSFLLVLLGLKPVQG